MMLLNLFIKLYKASAGGCFFVYVLLIIILHYKIPTVKRSMAKWIRNPSANAQSY